VTAQPPPETTKIRAISPSIGRGIPADHDASVGKWHSSRSDYLPNPRTLPGLVPARHLSSIGHCFDIDNTVREALEMFERTPAPYCGSSAPDAAGNGSLMRLVPGRSPTRAAPPKRSSVPWRAPGRPTRPSRRSGTPRSLWVRKVWKQLLREGYVVARCTVARLMRRLGPAGAGRGRAFSRTTIPDAMAPGPPDLVTRQFTATRPNQL
jgi:HTH-like domain/ADP-ribosylglycohydrolase